MPAALFIAAQLVCEDAGGNTNFLLYILARSEMAWDNKKPAMLGNMRVLRGCETV
jgi:hypothetical protein